MYLYIFLNTDGTDEFLTNVSTQMMPMKLSKHSLDYLYDFQWNLVCGLLHCLIRYLF